MFAYLIQQSCIDYEIVIGMMKRKLIYKDENRNIIFVGYNKDKEPVCATKRSTNTGSTYKGDVLGSDKSYGFYIKNSSNTLFVIESPIYVFSIMTFCKLKSKSFNENNYLALLSATNYKALENTLKDNKNITKVILCIDNDNAGRKSLEELSKIISNEYGYIKIYKSTLKQKDFNEDLVMYVSKIREYNKSLKKEMEKEEERQLSVWIESITKA